MHDLLRRQQRLSPPVPPPKLLILPEKCPKNGRSWKLPFGFGSALIAPLIALTKLGQPLVNQWSTSAQDILALGLAPGLAPGPAPGPIACTPAPFALSLGVAALWVENRTHPFILLRDWEDTESCASARNTEWWGGENGTSRPARVLPSGVSSVNCQQ